MSIRQRIMDDLKTAMKARDRTRLETLRMLKSRIQDAEVALRSEKGLDYALDDDEAIRVVSSYAKQRRDSISSYEEVGREDMAARERSELDIVHEYLPRQLGPEEIRQIVKDAIEEVGAGSPGQMGAVMKVVMPKVKGVADGKLVNQMVREMLEGS